MKKVFLICLLSCLHLAFFQIVFAGEGQEAGRAWAESKGIDNPDDCRSANPGGWMGDNINNSESFTEGCLEYLRDKGITNDVDEIITKDDDDKVTTPNSKDEEENEEE